MTFIIPICSGQSIQFGVDLNLLTMSPLVVAFYVYVSLHLLFTYVTLVLVQLHVMLHAVVVHPSLDVNCIRTELAFVDVCVLEMIVGLDIWSRLVWRDCLLYTSPSPRD